MSADGLKLLFAFVLIVLLGGAVASAGHKDTVSRTITTDIPSATKSVLSPYLPLNNAPKGLDDPNGSVLAAQRQDKRYKVLETDSRSVPSPFSLISPPFPVYLSLD